MRAEKAFFLDRDGTLNVDHDFVHKIEEWDWISGVPEALVKIKSAGYRIVVVTNQSGIARGRFNMKQVNELHEWVNRDLEQYDVQIDAFYIAPWHPDFHDHKNPELLKERKPGTELFKMAAEWFNIDFRQSVMVGDKTTDVEPALKLGMKPYLVESRFTDEKLRRWASEQDVPLLKSLPEVVGNYLSTFR